MSKPKSELGFVEGMINGLGKTHLKEDFKIFDWNKAAKYIVDNNVKNAEAGLQGDWEYTGGSILSCGNIDMNGYTYLCSSWALPYLFDKDNNEMIECYVTDENNIDNWDSDTKWPESAVDILNGK